MLHLTRYPNPFVSHGRENVWTQERSALRNAARKAIAAVRRLLRPRHRPASSAAG